MKRPNKQTLLAVARLSALADIADLIRARVTPAMFAKLAGCI